MWAQAVNCLIAVGLMGLLWLYWQWLEVRERKARLQRTRASLFLQTPESIRRQNRFGVSRGVRPEPLRRRAPVWQIKTRRKRHTG